MNFRVVVQRSGSVRGGTLMPQFDCYISLYIMLLHFRLPTSSRLYCICCQNWSLKDCKSWQMPSDIVLATCSAGTGVTRGKLGANFVFNSAVLCVYRETLNVADSFNLRLLQNFNVVCKLSNSAVNNNCNVLVLFSYRLAIPKPDEI